MTSVRDSNAHRFFALDFKKELDLIARATAVLNRIIGELVDDGLKTIRPLLIKAGDIARHIEREVPQTREEVDIGRDRDLDADRLLALEVLVCHF